MKNKAFTLIELMIVILIIAIIAAISIGYYNDYANSTRIADMMHGSDADRIKIAEFYQANNQSFGDNSTSFENSSLATEINSRPPSKHGVTKRIVWISPTKIAAYYTI